MGQDIKNNKELGARLLAVQACYQNMQNEQPVRMMVREYLDIRSDIEVEEGETPKPDGALFKKILMAVDIRKIDVEAILESVLPQKSEDPEAVKKPIEPLLKAILLCGITELLVHSDIDQPLIIDDYLNVTHAFYDQNQVRFVNGILDQVAKSLR